MHLKKNDICCIFNLAAIYRAPIFKLIDQEFKCDFYLGDKVSYSLKLMDYNELVGFKKKLKFIKLIANFYWQRGAISLAFKSYKIYIITGEPYCISTWVLLAITKILRKKTYLWTHGWYGRESIMKKIIKKIFFSLSAKVLLYGDYARNLMIKEGFNQDKLICIYNSLDYNNQYNIRNSLTYSAIYTNYFGNEDPVILYIGRVLESKKLDQLILSLRLLHQKTPCNLIIIGSGEDELRLSELVTQCKLNNNVWFYGACYEEKQLGNLIYNANVCVSPGNVGLMALHSLMYGTPVITHNNFKNQGPEFGSITPALTGNFFIEDSIEDLSEKIIPWLSLNKNERNLVKQKCYEIIDNRYNPNYQLSILKNIFEK